ncbi:hypothetical protein CLV78_104194 [Aliiruegeria haliotis]|uniref:Uncharacterized protein n=1 Tax=Aliiruegeria haliotis TaxID=1280846 RepID=A0A2T0RRD7_9RHOB|nr:hypothetical protein [Aliiruegeria haliotis]PRY23702.1 hypothetical protein CLV78_104194 [Aliiruegeria haliotis]
MRYWALGLAGGLFYAAPIGAGLTGASYFAIVPFTGLFFLWLLVMRHTPFEGGAAAILPTLMLHGALASMCLGAGHMLRAVLGVEAKAPLLAWLVMGLGGIALGRIIWRPRKEAEVEALLEKALRSLDTFAGEAEQILDEEPDLPLRHPTGAEAAALAVAYGALDALPADGAREDTLHDIVTPLEQEVRSHVLLEALANRAERTGTRRDRHAALLLAADGSLAWRELGEGRMATVFEQIVDSADTVTLAHFLRHANALLEGFPTTARDLPGPARLREIAGQIVSPHPELATGLTQLAHRLEDLQPEMPDD